jgi:hypothetical protein
MIVRVIQASTTNGKKKSHRESSKALAFPAAP